MNVRSRLCAAAWVAATLAAVLAISSAAAGSSALQAVAPLREPLPQRVGQRAHRHKQCKRIAQGQVARREAAEQSGAEEAATSPHEAARRPTDAPGPRASAARTDPAARGLAPQLLGRRLRRGLDGRRRKKAEAAGHAARLREAELPRAAVRERRSWQPRSWRWPRSRSK